MSQYKSQIQNLFLSMVRKRHQPVEVVLNTGTTLRGKIKGYDQFSITITFKDKAEVVYKSAILYITALPKKMYAFAHGGPGTDGPRRFSPGAPRFPRPGIGSGSDPSPRPGMPSRPGSVPRPAPIPRPAPPSRPASRPRDDDDDDPPPPRKTPKMIIDIPLPRRHPRPP